MKQGRKRFVGYRLSFNGRGEVLIRVDRQDLAALQTAWGWFLREWTAANGPGGPDAAFLRVMSGTLYNKATSAQRGKVIEFRAYAPFARDLALASERLLAERLIVNDPELAKRIIRAIAALKGESRELNDEALAAQPYRSGDSTHNSRVARARKRLKRRKFQANA